MVAPRRRVITKRIGELLLERRVVTEDHLKVALKVQEERGGFLGQILVDLGYVTEEAIAQALTAQYGFPYLPLKHYTIDAQLMKLIPEEMAKRNGIVPVDRIGDTLTIAMFDPLNDKSIAEVEEHTKCSVQVFVATMSDLQQAIEHYYGGRRA